MTCFKDINKNFPIRNTDKEKNDFINWLKEYTKDSSVKMQIVDNGKHKNIVFNNPNLADIIFTAHYDTPKSAIIPNLMFPKNRFIKFAYNVIPFIFLSGFSLFISFLISDFISFKEDYLYNLYMYILFLTIYFSLFKVLFNLKKNVNNYNDNTSGVSTIIDLVKKVDNNKVSYILFDNEEKGKKGSLSFVKDNLEIKENKIVINFDCVGNGNNFIFIYTEKLKSSRLFNVIKDTYSTIENSYFFDNKEADNNSDNKNFKKSLAVLATKKTNKGIFYCDLIHTNKDVIVDERNIEKLVDKSSELINKLFI